jgi:NAD(P)H-dependent FMN reductase
MSVAAVIVGSTRPTRFSEKPARWIARHLEKHPGVDAKILDLRDYPMPFFEESVSPAQPDRAPFENDVVRRWTAEIGSSDAFIVITPEYNHGYPAVLKNALDYVYHEWVRKPISFISYGNVGGARAVEQLRLVAVELQMAPIRRAVHLPLQALMAHHREGDVDEALKESDGAAQQMIEELLWWTEALKKAREAA